MTKTIENLFTTIHFITGISVVLLFIFFIRNLSKNKALTYLALYSFIEIFLNFIDQELSPRWFSIAWSSFTFLEYSAFIYFIYLNLSNNKVKKIIITASIVFYSFLILYYLLTPSIHQVDSIPIGVETIFVLSFSFYFLFEQMNDTSTLFIYSRYQFWIVIGIMIYLAGSFFIFIFASRLDKQLMDQFWFLTNGFYSIMNVFFIIAFILRWRETKKVTNPQQFRPYLN